LHGGNVKTVVVNKRAEAYDVYIGRPSKWGNPFFISGDQDRETAIQRYREWIVTKPTLLADLKELKGKRLGCFCKPLSCHGDVLAEMADKV
jgi:hypothetical protein